MKNEWKECGNYSYMEDVLKLLPSQKWAFRNETKTNEGIKRYFRCTENKSRGKQCIAKRYILISSTDHSFSLYTTGDTHNHDSRPPRGLNDAAKDVINNAYAVNKRITAKIGRRALIRNGINGTTQQVNYHMLRPSVS